jgi:hypothetical protein
LKKIDKWKFKLYVIRLRLQITKFKSTNRSKWYHYGLSWIIGYIEEKSLTLNSKNHLVTNVNTRLLTN